MKYRAALIVDNLHITKWQKSALDEAAENIEIVLIINCLITKIKKNYDVQSDPRYAAARMWIDEIIDPRETRNVIIRSLEIVAHQTKMPEPKFGVLQV
jgi:acetyl-CoA carboxylase carboxyltransferase component